MNDLGTALVPHHSYREVECCLCGRAWEQHFVAVALVVADRTLGDLCPRCLTHTPAAAVAPLAAAAARMGLLYEELDRCSPGQTPGGADQFRQTLARFLEASRRVRSAARLAREWGAEARARAGQVRDTAAGLVADARRLCTETAALRATYLPPAVVRDAEPVLDFAHALGELGRWPTTVAEAVESEATYFLGRYPGLTEEEVRSAVGGRYREFLAGAS